MFSYKAEQAVKLCFRPKFSKYLGQDYYLSA